MLAQISDGKLSLGGFFNGFMVNVKEYEGIINKFSNLNLSKKAFHDTNGEYNWKAISKSIGEVNYLTEDYFKSLADGNGVIDNTSASLDGMKAYLKQTGQAFDFAKLKAMALNSVLNIGMNAAISLGIIGLVKFLLH